MDYQIIGKDGGKRALEISAYLMKDQEGKPVGFRGVTRDITEKKQAEEMRRAKLAAEAASKAKGEFLANMSHEIRTPLNIILGMSEMLKQVSHEPEQQEYIDAITYSGNLLLRLPADQRYSYPIDGRCLDAMPGQSRRSPENGT